VWEDIMKEWLAIAFEGTVVRRAVKMMAIVGCILALINHGDALVAGTMTATAWMKVFLTFAVPYCVSTISSVQALRLAAKA
jgi:hypothetical protein